MIECPECKHQFQHINVDGVMHERRLMHDAVQNWDMYRIAKARLIACLTALNHKGKGYPATLSASYRERQEVSAAISETLTILDQKERGVE